MIGARELLLVGLLLAIPLIACAAGARLAPAKGRDALTWGVICLVFPPALLALILAPRAPGAGAA